jgi:hypothetical protein
MNLRKRDATLLLPHPARLRRLRIRVSGLEIRDSGNFSGSFSGSFSVSGSGFGFAGYGVRCFGKRFPLFWSVEA